MVPLGILRICRDHGSPRNNIPCTHGVKNKPSLINMVALPIHINERRVCNKVGPKTRSLNKSMSSSTSLKVGEDRTSINESGKCEFIGQNQGSLHLMEQKKCHFGLTLADITSHKRSLGHDITVRYFVEQFLCRVDSKEPEIAVSEMVGGKSVIGQNRI